MVNSQDPKKQYFEFPLTAGIEQEPSDKELYNQQGFMDLRNCVHNHVGKLEKAKGATMLPSDIAFEPIPDASVAIQNSKKFISRDGNPILLTDPDATYVGGAYEYTSNENDRNWSYRGVMPVSRATEKALMAAGNSQSETYDMAAHMTYDCYVAAQVTRGSLDATDAEKSLYYLSIGLFSKSKDAELIPPIVVLIGNSDGEAYECPTINDDTVLRCGAMGDNLYVFFNCETSIYYYTIDVSGNGPYTIDGPDVLVSDLDTSPSGISNPGCYDIYYTHPQQASSDYLFLFYQREEAQDGYLTLSWFNDSLTLLTSKTYTDDVLTDLSVSGPASQGSGNDIYMAWDINSGSAPSPSSDIRSSSVQYNIAAGPVYTLTDNYTPYTVESANSYVTQICIGWATSTKAFLTWTLVEAIQSNETVWTEPVLLDTPWQRSLARCVMGVNGAGDQSQTKYQHTASIMSKFFIATDGRLYQLCCYDDGSHAAENGFLGSNFDPEWGEEPTESPKYPNVDCQTHYYLANYDLDTVIEANPIYDITLTPVAHLSPYAASKPVILFDDGRNWPMGHYGRKTRTMPQKFEYFDNSVSTYDWRIIARSSDYQPFSASTLGSQHLDRIDFINIYNFLFTNQGSELKHTEINDISLVTGGITSILDRDRIAEAAFLHYPIIQYCGPTDDPIQPGPLDGYYSWTAVYVYRIGDRVIRSYPAKPIKGWCPAGSGDLALGSCANLRVYYNHWTLRQQYPWDDVSGGSQVTAGVTVSVELYRTVHNGTDYYLCSTIGSSINENPDELNNKPYLEYFECMDGTDDDDLINQTPLYTNGGILPVDPPPASEAVAFWRNRSWISHNNFIFYSKEIIQGRLPEFSGAQVISVPQDGGEINALIPGPNGLYIVKEDSIYTITGWGPNDQGFNANISQPDKLTAQYGAKRHSPIVDTESGYCMISERGPMILDPGNGAIDMICEKIRDFVFEPENNLESIWHGATWDPKNRQIWLSIEIANSDVGPHFVGSLIYSTKYKQWYRNDIFSSFASDGYSISVSYADVQDHIFTGDRMYSLVFNSNNNPEDYRVYAHANAQYYINATEYGEETSYKPYYMTIETPWLRPAIDTQDSWRARWLYLLGKSYEVSGLNITYQYDYQESDEMTYETYITSDNIEGDNSMPTMFIRQLFPRMRTQAVKIIITETEENVVEPDVTSRGFEFDTLRIEYGYTGRLTNPHSTQSSGNIGRAVLR